MSKLQKDKRQEAARKEYKEEAVALHLWRESRRDDGIFGIDLRQEPRATTRIVDALIAPELKRTEATAMIRTGNRNGNP